MRRPWWFRYMLWVYRAGLVVCIGESRRLRSYRPRIWWWRRRFETAVSTLAEDMVLSAKRHMRQVDPDAPQAPDGS